MSEAKIKACPFCGKPPTIKQAGRTNYWWVGCEIHLGPESIGCGVSHSDYIREEAIRKWNERAGDREPATSQTTEPSTLASATCSLADERSLSDLLAAALVGEYPAEAALKRYCATLASPFDVQVVMAKFRSKPANCGSKRTADSWREPR